MSQVCLRQPDKRTDGHTDTAQVKVLSCALTDKKNLNETSTGRIENPRIKNNEEQNLKPNKDQDVYNNH